MVGFLGLAWIAFVVGVVVGWAWTPKWAGGGRDKLACFPVSKTCDSPSSSSPSGSIFSPKKVFVLNFRINSFKLRRTISGPWGSGNKVDKEPLVAAPSVNDANCSVSQATSEESFVFPERELKHLYQLVELKDGGPAWVKMMDQSTPNMGYQAWRRDPETGPPQYHSRTIFVDVMPELVRDFFWDDEFRSNWDDMLTHSATIDECPSMGSMVVHWVRKFPFFCSDREYIIGRRIWESEKLYYCVTKAVPYPSIPRCTKPRRVDLYHSSWCVRAAESRKGNEQLTACEVIVFHHEDMGIPREVAKLAVRQGMWGAVRKIEHGLRAYQKSRASGATLSRPAIMAQINTKVVPECLRSFGAADDSSESGILAFTDHNQPGSNILKLLIVGGAVLLACSLDHGLSMKAVTLGVARMFSKRGKRLEAKIFFVSFVFPVSFPIQSLSIASEWLKLELQPTLH